MKNPLEDTQDIHQEGQETVEWKAKEDTSVTLPCFGIQHDKVQ